MQKLERLATSQQPLSQPNRDFGIELSILINGHGPALPGQRNSVVAVRQSIGSHRGGNWSGGQTITAQERYTATLRAQGWTNVVHRCGRRHPAHSVSLGMET